MNLEYYILNFFTLPILIVNEKMKVIFFNKAMENFIGKIKVDTDYNLFFKDKYPIKVFRDTKKFLGINGNINNTNYTADYLPYKNSQGLPTSVIIVFYIKKLCVEWLIKAMDAIPDAILLCDENQVVKYINPSYTKLKGLHWDEIVGKKINEVRPYKLIPSVVNTGISINNMYRQLDDMKFTVDIMPIINNNKIVGGISISKDLSQIKELINSCNHAYATLKEDKKYNDSDIKEDNLFSKIIGYSPILLEVLEKAKIASKINSNVLIFGETGTGKELIAQAIHNGGKQKKGLFVAINCAAIPTELMESELFGHEGGAFTGAKNQAKIGLFEIANGGTIFLDEIGELSLSSQTKLLRVLENKKIRRVGGLKEIPINVRILAATNRDLKLMLEEGDFREDLYYRLNVFQINIPPLRKRLADIPLLANHIIKKVCLQLDKKSILSEESLKVLLNYKWPGNVRELENALEYAINISDSHLIEPKHLPLSIHNSYLAEPPISANEKTTNMPIPLENLEKQSIIAALKVFGLSTSGKRKSAQFLGISLTTLYNKIKKYKIKNI